MGEKFRETESILRNYKKFKSELDMWNLKKEHMKNQIDGVNAIGYEERSSPTNKFNSIVENEAVRRERELKEIEDNIQDCSIKIKKVDIALAILTDREKTIIERRYFDRAKNIDIALELNLTEEYVCDLKRDIVNRISDILFLT